MITGKIYGPLAPQTGSLAICLSDRGDGWVLVISIDPPEMPFPGMSRDEHVVAGHMEVYEAKEVDSIPSQDEISNLQHMVYVKNS
jgi:hypothetical protein